MRRRRYSGLQNNNKLMGCGVLAGFILLFLVLAWIVLNVVVIPLATHTRANITIDHKERIAESNNNSRYLIWSKEGEVFEDTDTLFNGKFDSSDLYGQLQERHVYNCDVYGWRIPFFSYYRNIVTCKPA